MAWLLVDKSTGEELIWMEGIRVMTHAGVFTPALPRLLIKKSTAGKE